MTQQCTKLPFMIKHKLSNYYCLVDPEFIMDRFNSVGLENCVGYFVDCLRMLTGKFVSNDSEYTEKVTMEAKLLYGLLHARYILTQAGLYQVHKKFEQFVYGHCPRVLCEGCPLLPIGQSTIVGFSKVNYYCHSCEDIYENRFKPEDAIDGAFFGPSYPYVFLRKYWKQVQPGRINVYIPRIFGFKVRKYSQENQKREKIRKRVEKCIRDSKKGPDEEVSSYESD